MQFLSTAAHTQLWLKVMSVVTVVAAMAKLFDWLDGLMSDKARVALWYFLGNIPDDDEIDSWGLISKKKPMQAIGRIAAVLVGTGYICLLVILNNP